MRLFLALAVTVALTVALAVGVHNLTESATASGLSVICDSRHPTTVEVDGASYTVGCPDVGVFPLTVARDGLGRPRVYTQGTPPIATCATEDSHAVVPCYWDAGTGSPIRVEARRVPTGAYVTFVKTGCVEEYDGQDKLISPRCA